LPLNLGIRIPEGDFVFKVAEICESLDYTELFSTYLRSWRKVNPITIFELIVYGYMKHMYSGRAIAEACKTDIRFMWLLNGEPAPSHATISRFEDEKLSEAILSAFLTELIIPSPRTYFATKKKPSQESSYYEFSAL